MPTFPITVVNDPANISTPDVFKASGSLLDWLIDQYGADGFDVPTSIYMGSISELSEIDINDFKQLNRTIDAPVFIIHQPLGIDPFTLIVSVVLALAVTALMPTPDISSIEGPGQAKRSPNNALSGQQNIARTLERVPDIFGKVLSFPDLIAPTVQEFIGHVKFQTEYMCIGRGYYDIENIKSGETLISDVNGSTADVYDPGSAPSTILKTSTANSVSSQVITNTGSGTAFYMPTGSIVSYNAGAQDEAAISSQFNTSSSLPPSFQPGVIITLTEVYVDIAAVEYNLDGSYEILTAVNSEFGWAMTIAEVTTENANWLNVGIGDFVLFIAGAVPVAPSISGADGSSGPFTVPGENLYQVWLDVQAPRGLADGASLDEPLSVTVEFLFEQIDSVGVPTGSNFTHSVIFTDSTIESRFWTVKVGVADGLLVGTRYRVSATRTTVFDPTTTIPADELRWTRLSGIEDISGPDTSGTTRILVQTQATEQVAALQDRKFNMHATRKTVYWDGASVVGDISTGAGLLGTRRMADAFLHYMLDPGLAAQSEANIDIQTVYDIQDEMDLIESGVRGEFSFTFDNKNAPALEEIRQIGQAARCFAFRQGSIFSMIRDQEQVVSRGLFNRRNKLPESETKSIQFNRPLDKDGVVIEYVDIDTDKPITITYPDDLDPGDEHFGLPDTINPLKIDGIGIRQSAQAIDRAQYELRRLIYNRTSMETTVTAEGILLPLNARIDCVDNTRLVSVISDGEVKAKSGLIVDTSERCIFVGGTYSVIFRDEEGLTSTPITVTERLDTEFGFVLDSDYTVVVRGDNDYQRGTLYSFGPDGNEFATSYLVQRKTPDGNGNVKLDLINYSEKYYEADAGSGVGVVGSDDSNSSQRLPGRLVDGLAGNITTAATHSNIEVHKIFQNISGRLISCKSDDNRLDYSDDLGDTWQLLTSDYTEGSTAGSSPDRTLNCLAQNPSTGRLIMSSRLAGMMYSDDDGENWTLSDWTSDGDLFSTWVKFGGVVWWNATLGKFVAAQRFRYANLNLATSSDGEIWTTSGNVTGTIQGAGISDAVHLPDAGGEHGRYVVVDAAGLGFYSDDVGGNWSATSPANIGSGTGLALFAYSPTKQKAIRVAGATLLRTTDGITWSSYALPLGLVAPEWSDLYQCWFAFEPITTRRLYYSTDEENWTLISGVSTTSYRGYADAFA